MRPTSRLLASVLLASLAGTAFAGEPARPDIVVFLADDIGQGDGSPYGGKAIRTPNMARLAADGLTFTRAFVASPSCAPSRAALLTGLDPLRNGAMLNHARPRATLKKWPDYFRDLGYQVAAIGKTAHYAQVNDYGFDVATNFTYHDDACIEAAVSWLKGRKDDRPLCLIVGTNWPHVPWPATSSYDPKALAVPPNLVDTPAMRQALAQYAEAVTNADRDLGLVYDAARATLKEPLFLFTGDHGAQLPFGKWNLYDAGVRTPLIASWPGRIRPGTTTDAMVGWVDLLPTCLEAAGAAPPDTISGRSFLGVLRGEKADHRDRVFLTHSGDGQMNRYPSRGVRTARWKYIRNLDSDAEHHTHIDKAKPVDGRSYWDSWVERAKTDPRAAATVRRYHHRPAEELYDLDADPWELRNLADDPDHAGTLAKLRDSLDAWMKDQGDEGLATERALPDPQAKAQPKAP